MQSIQARRHYCSHLCKQSTAVNTEMQKRGWEEAEGPVSLREDSGVIAILLHLLPQGNISSHMTECARTERSPAWPIQQGHLLQALPAQSLPSLAGLSPLGSQHDDCRKPQSHSQACAEGKVGTFLRFGLAVFVLQLHGQDWAKGVGPAWSAVLVSWSCRHRVPHTWWPKATETNCLTGGWKLKIKV